MKKIVLTIAVVMGMALATNAQYFGNEDNAVSAQGGGLFGRGETPEGAFDRTGVLLPMLPHDHGLTDDQDAPLGSGVWLLLGFGAAYALGKRKKDA